MRQTRRTRLGRSCCALAAVAAALLTTVVGTGTNSSAATTPGTDRAATPDRAEVFANQLVASVATPTAMAFTPDRRMLVTQDSGQLRVVQRGQLLETPALDLSSRLCVAGERGLLGVAVDPNFERNQYVYLYWTHNAHGYCGQGTDAAPENRVTRVTLGDDNVVVPGSERVIIDHLLAQRYSHNAGDLHFGADGLLYISVGDGACVIDDPTRCGAANTNSRRLDIPHGKILRVTRLGRIPSDNPYADAADARRCGRPIGPDTGDGPCAETFALGFRNPFRFALRPGTNHFWVNDVGNSTWEEINRLRPGRDYGWNVREGHCVVASTTDCGPTPYQNPLHDYSHAATQCGSITGGAFVPENLWATPFSGSYLFADYVCGTIFRLDPQPGGGWTQEPVLTDLGAPVHLEFGPWRRTRALYYLEYANGEVRRLSMSDTTSSSRRSR